MKLLWEGSGVKPVANLVCSSAFCFCPMLTLLHQVIAPYYHHIYIYKYLAEVVFLLSCLGTVVRCFGGISAEEVFLTLADL